ncbi:hypothetical protein ABH945_002398 [Paraburkholderia sp. GAS333]|uniref:hypothetical protein n=1 Tax=Paraburkholderia sp. GAS333 TaxID=3156279 RepID=UPI003D2020F3
MRVTKVDGLSRTKHWALGAVIAVLCSFVHAKGPGVPHGGGGFSGMHSGASYSHAPDRSMRADMRGGGNVRYSGAPAARSGRYQAADRNARSSRGAANYASDRYADGFHGANGFGVYSPSVRGLTTPSHYPDDGRGRMQYAGALTQVSAESRSVPRPPPNAPMRSGSIRADVARYNEERGASRVMQRQSDDPRQPEGSPYRN